MAHILLAFEVGTYTATLYIHHPNEPTPSTEQVRVLTEDFKTLPPLRHGEEMADEVYQSIKGLAELCEAVRYGMVCVERSSLSAARLYQKIRKKEFSPDVAKAAVRRVIAYGYLREEEQIRHITLTYIQKEWGPLKITHKLLEAGYHQQTIDRVWQEMTEKGELDFDRKAKEIAKRLASQNADQKTVLLTLHKMGFMPQDTDL